MKFHITSVSGKPKHTPQIETIEKVKAVKSQQRHRPCLAVRRGRVLRPRPPPRGRMLQPHTKAH